MAGWRSTQANWAEGRRVGSELQCTTVHYITVLYSTMLVLSFLRPSQKTFLLNFSDFSDFFYTCNLLCCTVKYRTVLNSRHWAVVLYRTITFGHEWGRILNGFKDVLVFLNFTEGCVESLAHMIGMMVVQCTLYASECECLESYMKCAVCRVKWNMFSSILQHATWVSLSRVFMFNEAILFLPPELFCKEFSYWNLFI